MSGSKWEDYYRLYRSLKISWKWNNAPIEFNEKSFLETVTTANDPSLITKNMQARGYGIQDKDQWERALRLNEIVSELPSGTIKGEPLDDVYQAALRMETYERWRTKETRSQIFRGQRNSEWPVVANMFRIQRNDDLNISSKLEKITSLVRELQTSLPSISDEEGVAIIQHYSDVAGIGTWLIDFTWDPFVALFFASHGSHKGHKNDVVIICYIGLGEFKRLSAKGTNRLGAIKIIEPSGVPRISAQKALFLDTSHPDLYEQYVPHSLYFKQKKGLYFEDPCRTPPITENDILPPNDPFEKKFRGNKHVPNPMPLTVGPAPDASSPMTPDEYEKIVKSWFVSQSKNLTLSIQKIVRQLCIIYARLQDHREEIDIELRSLFLLEQAVETVQTVSKPSLEIALVGWDNPNIRGNDVVRSLVEQIDTS